MGVSSYDECFASTVGGYGNADVTGVYVNGQGWGHMKLHESYQLELF